MRIQCFVGKAVQWIWLGRSLAGLYDQPGCSVSIKIVDWIHSPVCLAIEVEGKRLVIELYDHANEWDLNLLEWCDVYAKRNIHPLHVTPLQHKIVPFGFHLAAHSRRSALAVLAAIAAAVPSGYRLKADDLYRYLVTPHWRDFELQPNEPVEQTVLFQTRVWPLDETAEDIGINERRVALLRALRNAFGPRFVGGLVPTPFARAHYPDLITSFPTRQPQYVKWARKPGVAVYCPGLFGAIAIKMAEFLAASKGIVSEPIENLLPAPLSHVAFCGLPDEYVSACEALLTQPERMRAGREASWAYYREYVYTPTAMRRLLNLVLTSG